MGTGGQPIGSGAASRRSRFGEEFGQEIAPSLRRLASLLMLVEPPGRTGAARV